MVEATIDLAALEEHQFVIKPDFDDNLKNYRKRMDDLRDDMATEHIRVGHDLNQDTEKKLKLEQQHVYGWCLRLTRNVTFPEVRTDFRKPDLSEERGDILYNLAVLL
jgi:DNA mismatch repair ATPase MutS